MKLELWAPMGSMGPRVGWEGGLWAFLIVLDIKGGGGV